VTPPAPASVWADALDALEQWVRGVALAASSRTEPVPAADAPALPHGPVPAEHRVRALALHAQMDDVLSSSRQSQQALAQRQAYTAV
jgi:hypothetical protein